MNKFRRCFASVGHIKSSQRKLELLLPVYSKTLNFLAETYTQTDNSNHTSYSYALLCCLTFPNLKSIIVGGRNTHTAITRECNVQDVCEVITGPLLLHVWTSGHSPHSYTSILRCRDGSRSVRKYCHTPEK